MLRLSPRRYWLMIPIATLFAVAWIGLSLDRPPHKHNHAASNNQQPNSAINDNTSLFIIVGAWADSNHDAIEALSAIGVFILTFVLTGSTIGLWIVTNKAANAATLAADVAKQTLVAAQRAWIKAKIDIGNIPLVFDQNGASTTVSFEITNVGNAPALNVTPHAWLIVGKQRQFPIAEQQIRFDEIRRQPFMFGFTLFPGENFPDTIGVGLWTVQVNVTRDDIDEGFRLTNGAYISLYVIGRIDYTFPIDAHMHHQTTFMLQLRKTLPDIFIRPDDGQIPPSSLTLTDFNFGLGRHAD